MRKWLKNWWFSIFCWICALIMSIWVVIGFFTKFDSDDYIITLLVLDSLSPILMAIAIGCVNQPGSDERYFERFLKEYIEKQKKENKDE